MLSRHGGIKTELIEVHSYSGYKLHEKPVRIIYKNEILRIKKIVHRSLMEQFPGGEPQYRFKVLCDNRKTYTIFYFTLRDQWFLVDQT